MGLVDEALIPSERIAYLWTADVAEHVLPLFIARYPYAELAMREALAVLRKYAEGLVELEEIRAAEKSIWRFVGDADDDMLKSKQAPDWALSRAAYFAGYAVRLACNVTEQWDLTATTVADLARRAAAFFECSSLVPYGDGWTRWDYELTYLCSWPAPPGGQQERRWQEKRLEELRNSNGDH